MLQLSELNIYPIKSTRGAAVGSVDLTPRGLLGDRRWMLVDESGNFLTQRQYSVLSLIDVEFTETHLLVRVVDVERLAEYSYASLSALAELNVTINSAGELQRVHIWADKVDAFDCGAEAAQWFSDLLGQSVRLVYQADQHLRAVDPVYGKENDVVSFADGFPLLLISEASLQCLNEKLKNKVLMNRFRPNIVISGCEPHAEDTWKKLRINNIVMDVVKPCSRCVIPSIDPTTGQKDSEILRVLTQYRRGEDGKIYFGQNLIHQSSGCLTVGDLVEVLE